MDTAYNNANKMKINVKHIAKLANLPLTPEEEKKFGEQLESTLEYVDHLNEIDTEKEEATNQVTGLENISDDDEIRPSLSQEEALSNVSDNKKHNGSFKVTAIFEDEPSS